MPSLFYAGQPDYIEKLNTLATAASMTNGTVAASFLSLAVTGTATAASFVGPLTGNASTATTLATARNINGVSFNGSADITVTAAAGTLTGATLAAGVTASSLTSVGTLTALTVSGQASFAAGSAAAPSVKVGAEQNGLYSSAANTLDVTLNGVRQAQFSYTAAAVNYPRFTGSTTGNEVRLSVQGTDTNAGMWLTTKGTGVIRMETGGGEQFRVAHTASAVNLFQVTGSAAGGFSNILESIGTDANIQNLYASKGTSGHVFRTGGSGGFTQFLIGNTTNAVNYLSVVGAATTASPLFLSQGSDTNVAIRYRTQGTGSHQFETGSSGNIGLLVNHVASAVNRYIVQGAVTTLPPFLYADGSDTNVSAGYSLKGAGNHVFYTGSTTAVQAYIVHTASAVNALTLTGSATGQPTRIGNFGSDTNSDILIAPQGTGVLRFGTFTSSGDVAVNGYITIKDSSGNTRRLATIA